jgi:RNA polymerase sigma-70 factor (ECF subfamily)
MPDARPPATLYDLAALARVFEEHRPRLSAVARRRLDPALGVRLTADDLLQQAFLDAARGWDAYRADPRISAFAWLYGVVRDRLIEEYRKASRPCRDLRRDLPWPEHTTLQLGLNLAASSGTPSQAVARDELVRRVRAAVATLPPADREIVHMHDFDGLTFAQVGEVLGMTANAVNQRHVRALRKLRAALGGNPS